jgi:hypothetical protein
MTQRSTHFLLTGGQAVIWAPCACGGVIVARTRDDIEEAVRRHQLETRHQLWRIQALKRELEGYKL